MKKKLVILGVFAATIVVFSQCHKAEVFPDDEYDARLSGGAATIFDQSSRAFTNSIDGLTGLDRRAQSLGDAAFEQPFIASSTAAGAHFTGLGPVFNNVSCISCHHNDGKGTPTAGFTNSSPAIPHEHPPVPTSLVARLLPAATAVSCRTAHW